MSKRPLDATCEVALSAGTFAEMQKLLQENPRNDLVFRAEDGSVAGVVLQPISYFALKMCEDMLKNPDAHHLMVRHYRDLGPSLTYEQVFKNAPLSPFLKVRIWLYDRRVSFYRLLGLRPEKV